MSPLAIGWYVVVRRCLQPRSWRSWAQSHDSNWRPRSVEIVEGTPKSAIQPVANVSVTVSAVMFGMGNVSGQRVKQSMQVSMYV
jgi:hypothetical protein